MPDRQDKTQLARSAPNAPLAPPEIDFALPPEVVPGVERLVKQARADATNRAYGRAWRVFAGWCAQQRRSALPAAPETVVAFIERHLDWSVPKMDQAVNAITAAHAMKEIDPPPTKSEKVRLVMRGFRRERGRPAMQKAPATRDELRKMILTLDRDTPRGKRDAALLLIGFAGAFRRSELVAIRHEHIREAPGGISILLPRSKTDQAGQGRTVGIARVDDDDLDPVSALEEWMHWEANHEGWVFRGFTSTGQNTRRSHLSPNEVALIVKRAAQAAGFDPTRFAGHSLRAGYVTQAKRDGAAWDDIAQQTGHTSMKMVKTYERDADPVGRAPQPLKR